MPFEPAFMQRLPEFKAALARVDSTEAWLAFKHAWFHDQPWPRRTPQALQALRPGETVQGGGRTFRRAPLPDDLTAEARYQYFAALQAAAQTFYDAHKAGTTAPTAEAVDQATHDTSPAPAGTPAGWLASENARRPPGPRGTP